MRRMRCLKLNLLCHRPVQWVGPQYTDYFRWLPSVPHGSSHSNFVRVVWKKEWCNAFQPCRVAPKITTCVTLPAHRILSPSTLKIRQINHTLSLRFTAIRVFPWDYFLALRSWTACSSPGLLNLEAPIASDLSLLATTLRHVIFFHIHVNIVQKAICKDLKGGTGESKLNEGER